ncbi:hypothetical protein ACFO5Q_14830 [Kordiimonas lipolytica]|uniref:Uncharacterized protein n=1 Tax=Kordiimonas lipolytica TaxID=1662421 RepID=A0ABV8UD11_9PROT|nr:hypothetical protein [Kordiimonas lipolytica]
MSGKSPVTITVVTENNTGGNISEVKVTVGGEVIDNLTGLGKGASSLPNQYSGPSGDLAWTVSFRDDDGNKKAGSVDSGATKADHSAKVILNADDFNVSKPSGDATGDYD